MQNVEALDFAAKKELARIAELPEVSLKEKRLIPPQYAAELDALEAHHHGRSEPGIHRGAGASKRTVA